jgi:hypothetical protein
MFILVCGFVLTIYRKPGQTTAAEAAVWGALGTVLAGVWWQSKRGGQHAPKDGP